MDSIINVARLVLACKEIKGRVKVQKIVHILQESGNKDFRQDYGYLHHGPYSSELAKEIDQLREGGYIDEDARQVNDYTRYVYKPTDHLLELEKELWDSGDPSWKALADDLNTKSSSELEAISTVMYLRRRKFSGERLRARFIELKPHLQDKYEESAAYAELKQKI